MPKTKLKISRSEETKRERFERIAQRRTNLTLRFIRLLGNLADRRNYDYSDEHVHQIFAALDQELKTMKGKFRSGSDESGRGFKFNGGKQ